MEDPKAIALLQEVAEKTKSGRIEWEPLADDDHFVASVRGKFTLLIIHYSFQGEDRFSLVLKDAEGTEVLRVTEYTEGVRPGQLEDLYGMARRQALRVDEKLDELLAELGNL
jgi:hypothetical protein